MLLDMHQSLPHCTFVHRFPTYDSMVQALVAVSIVFFVTY